MTSTLDRRSPYRSPEGGLTVPPAPRPGGKGPATFWAPPVVGLLAGVPLVVYSFHYAATHRTTQTEFDLFWLGMLAFAVPAGIRALGNRAHPSARWALVAMLGVWDYFPKFLRDPSAPLFSDELAHFRQTVDVVSTGKLYPPNTLIPIISQFPGQQALVGALHDVTGLSVWVTAEILLAFFHAATVVGVMALAARLTGSYRAGAIAALFFAVTPNFMFFDSEYSYESFALPMVVWTLVAAANVTRRGERSTARWAWTAVGSVTGLACVVTHHLSSYILAVLLVLIAAGHTMARSSDANPVSSRPPGKAVWALTAVVAAGCGLWLIPAHSVIGYYSPYVSKGVLQVFHLVSRSGHSRQLFKGSASPIYERLFAFAAPPLLLALTALAMLRHRPLLVRFGPAYKVLVAAGVVGYFSSLPFILTAFGNEGARRSWTFTYIGLAMLAGPVLNLYLAAGARRGLWPVVTAVSLVVLLIGNTASSVDVEYRFPGPYVYGSDTRSLTSELMYLTGWFQKTQAAHAKVITDRYTGLPLAGFAGADLASPSPGFPVWDMFFDTGGPPAGLLTEIGYSGYSYLVVDSRMARYLPAIGVYFVASEPGALDHLKPVPAQALNRYHLQPWATEVLNSTHYSVYRLDLRALAKGGS